jgi:Mg/Co/Ni transporter MgtE
MQRHSEMIQKIQREESLTELLGELTNQSASLVRDEIALAKQEMHEKLVNFRASLVVVALGSVLALIATFTLCAALIAGLSLYLPVWQAALIVGGIFAIAAGVVVSIGITQLKQVSLKPKETIKTLEENKQWLKEIA